MAFWTWTTLRWGWTRSTDKRNSSTNGPRTETAEGSKQALMYCCFEAEGAFCWVKWDSDDRATDSLATLLYYYYLLKKRLSLARLYTCVKIIPFQECRPIYCANSQIILSYWGYSRYSRQAILWFHNQFKEFFIPAKSTMLDGLSWYLSHLGLLSRVGT